jgi:hypothetical protein
MLLAQAVCQVCATCFQSLLIARVRRHKVCRCQHCPPHGEQARQFCPVCRPWAASGVETYQDAARATRKRAGHALAHDAPAAASHLRRVAEGCMRPDADAARLHRNEQRAADGSAVAGVGSGGGGLVLPERPPFRSDRERDPQEFAAEVVAAALSVASRAVGASDDAARRAEAYADAAGGNEDRGIPLATRQPALGALVNGVAGAAAAADEAARVAEGVAAGVPKLVREGEHEAAVELTGEVRVRCLHMLLL